HIQIVDELLHDVIAGEPREVVPVPTLPLHVRHAGLPLAQPDGPGQVVRLRTDDLPDRALVNLPDGFHETRLAAIDRAGHEREASLGGHSTRVHDGMIARHVYVRWFLEEDMAACLDGIAEMERAKSGWRGHNHVVDVAVDDVLIVVEAGEGAVIGHVEAGGQVLGQSGTGLIQPIVDPVPHRHDFDTLGGLDGVDGRTRAAPAATNHTHADAVRPGGIGKIRAGHQRTRARNGHGRSPNEISTSHTRWPVIRLAGSGIHLSVPRTYMM